MRWVGFWILCTLLGGCGDNGSMNNRAYVITQTQVDEMEEAPTPEIEN